MSSPAITLTTTDPAAVNMLAIFRELGFRETPREGILRRDGVDLVVLGKEIVPSEGAPAAGPDPYPLDYDAVAKEIGTSYFVVASRHSAASGRPCFTVHSTGNFGDALYGGRPRELQMSPANPLRDVYMELQKSPPEGFQVSLEATHHSPTQFETPMFFAEVGSCPEQWGNMDACRHLAEAILRGIEARGRAKTAIGFGGGHYCPKFSVMETEYAFGHIAAKYALDKLDDGLITQMMERTEGGAEAAFIESGSRSSDKKRIADALAKAGIELQTA